MRGMKKMYTYFSSPLFIRSRRFIHRKNSYCLPYPCGKTMHSIHFIPFLYHFEINKHFK